MDERSKLKNGQEILLAERKQPENIRIFHIENVINEGSTVICYEALNEDRTKGVLKEFYPRTAYGLERNSQGQLIHSEKYKAAFKRFTREEKEYIDTYEMLSAEKQSGLYSDMETFIPHFELYYGCDDIGKKTGTTYIWTPHPQIETFEKICSEIHADPYTEPEHKLVLVLSAIKSLTECICSLHCAGMLHRDIKPSNFGFLKCGDELLTQSVSIVDVDSICSVYKYPEKIVYTEGVC